MSEQINNILNDVEIYIKDRQSSSDWVEGRDQINYSGTYYDHREYVAAVKTLLSGWMGMGKDSNHFESLFPRHLGKKFGSLVNSGSSANLLMYATLLSKNAYGLKKGTRIITPVAGFPTTINPILQLGFEPVFVDIELNTLNIDIDQFYNACKTSNAQVVCFAHVLGNPPNIDKILDICTQFNLILLEDCCDALGSMYDDKLLGSFGDMATCSFYPAHHISLGEGGFVATKNNELNDVVKSLRDWGRGCYCQGEKANKLVCGTCGKRFSEWVSELPGEIFDHKYIYNEIGFNLKPIELQASIGLQQLHKLPVINTIRRHNFELLFETYRDYEKYFILPRATEKSDPAWFAFPLTVKENSPFTRKDIVSYLEEKKIQTRPYFAGNILLQPGYSDIRNNYFPNAKTDFPNATYATTSTFFHGTSPTISVKQMIYIRKMVKNFMSKFQ
jgi:CDP-6-deoxy-D-xylo-4-hexulose-3-dehydrase